VTELDFLGTGNFLAPPGRYWNSFVMDGSVLVEPCPTALPHLRAAGFGVEDVDVIVVSHFHADHCFGWPFLSQALGEMGGGRTVWVVGPPGIEDQLATMNEVGAVRIATRLARQPDQHISRGTEPLQRRFPDMERIQFLPHIGQIGRSWGYANLDQGTADEVYPVIEPDGRKQHDRRHGQQH